MAYHDRTKHHPQRYALGPGGLDWATQPNPFRRFDGSPVLKLPLADHDDTPAAAVLFKESAGPPRPLTLEALGLFFELSMGLSARKEIPGMSWYLRMNPSSGNLHPTEAYAVLPALEWLPGGAGDRHDCADRGRLQPGERKPRSNVFEANHGKGVFVCSGAASRSARSNDAPIGWPPSSSKGWKALATWMCTKYSVDLRPERAQKLEIGIPEVFSSVP